MRLVTLGIIAAGGIIAFMSKSPSGTLFDDADEQEENAESEWLDTEPPEQFIEQSDTVSSNLPAYDPVEHQNNPQSTLRRGDRFICPETGQPLQVRAVGGRPMHKTEQNVD